MHPLPLGFWCVCGKPTFRTESEWVLEVILVVVNRVDINPKQGPLGYDVTIDDQRLAPIVRRGPLSPHCAGPRRGHSQGLVDTGAEVLTVGQLRAAVDVAAAGEGRADLLCQFAVDFRVAA